MTDTQQKLMYAYIMLEQAKHNSNDYTVFIANLDAFVTDARSVTLIMQTEFDSIKGFKEWYNVKQQEMKENSDFDFFNNLRRVTTHVHPFNAVSKITTSFQDGMTISGGKIVDILFGDYSQALELLKADRKAIKVLQKNLKEKFFGDWLEKNNPRIAKRLMKKQLIEKEKEKKEATTTATEAAAAYP